MAGGSGRAFGGCGSLDAAVVLAAALAIAAVRSPSSARDIAAGAPPALIARMGESMTESDARHRIAFRPFTPARLIVGVALLPPFRGDDTKANRGIAFEYRIDDELHYVLAEWPLNGGDINRFPPLRWPRPGCPSARSFARGAQPRGIVWSTPHGLVMTLQTEGATDARTLWAEWTKLVRRGACRQ